ncbi:hypothetical protein DPMN_098074 [Dreissena polymorpha]|uniref:Uncharacterized protein n=1 Tax=Dreissena polymorpha TaxID=45954 RepID=A0A9D4LEG8_DREPO|nr:hypothetical protein DPMN_098074 [Dreissena polymorpha]
MTLLDYSHGRRLETLSGWQTSSSAVHTSRETLVAIVFGYTPLILWEYLPRAQAKPPRQDTKSHANTYTSQAHIHRLIYTG